MQGRPLPIFAGVFLVCLLCIRCICSFAYMAPFQVLRLYHSWVSGLLLSVFFYSVSAMFCFVGVFSVVLPTVWSSFRLRVYTVKSFHHGFRLTFCTIFWSFAFCGLLRTPDTNTSLPQLALARQAPRNVHVHRYATINTLTHVLPLACGRSHNTRVVHRLSLEIQTQTLQTDSRLFRRWKQLYHSGWH